MSASGLPVNPIDTLKDAVRTLAFQRGAKKPDWSDVWVAVAKTDPFRKSLAERGVSLVDFVADISFILRIGSKTGAALQEKGKLTPEELTKIREDLIKNLKEIAGDVPEDQKESINKFIDIVAEKLADVTLADDDAQREEKFKLLRKATERFMTASRKAFAVGNAAISLSALSISIARLLESEIYYNPENDDETQDDVIAYLDELSPNILSSPSAIDLIEGLLIDSGPLYSNLLFRNGYFSDDPDWKDEFADQIPSEKIRNLALSGLEQAYRAKSRAVDARHIMLSILEDHQVQINLSKLGMKNINSFVQDFVSLAFAQEEKESGNLKTHPRVSDSFKELIWNFNKDISALDEDGQGPALFAQILKSDASVAEFLTKAGFTAEMAANWQNNFDEKWTPKDKLKSDGPKKKTEFEVADDKLEELIGQYCVDYTELAKKQKFDPLIGQEKVMEKLTTTLLKRGRKNPILIGDAGVGKSKLLEGLAQRIIEGNVPEKLMGARVLSLDLHSINTSPFVGIFESRILPILKGIAERNASGRFPIIQLAIDEFGNAMDAGAHSQGEGIKGMIKPYLTTGDLVVIGATTQEEYQKKVQKDGALSRRFNPIALSPPNVAETTKILQQLKSRYESHHKMRIPDDLLAEVAEMADRYIQTNQPDKSIDLMDYACAMAARDKATVLKRKHVVEAASDVSGIAHEFLNGDDEKRYRVLPDNLNKEVLQQKEAVAAVSGPLQRAKQGLKDPNKPLGTFLFVGPTGVGKTELAKALARFLFGSDEHNLLRYDMSEFQEKHDASRLVGAPPGFVGFEEGGKLVNDVNAHPFSVILYDEIEKAHRDVCNALLAPFDSGKVTDGRNRSANMKQTINIMTSNLGAREVVAEGKRKGLDPVKDFAAWQEMAKPIYQEAVKRHFTPEFLNRIDEIVYFENLSKETIDFLVSRRVTQTCDRLEKSTGLKLKLSEEFRQALVSQGFDILNGARPLKRAVEKMLEAPLASFLLAQDKKSRKKAKSVVASLSADKNPEFALA